MKRLMLSFILASMFFISTFGQETDLYGTYSRIEGVRSQIVGPVLLKLALMSVKGYEKDLLKSVNQLRLLDFSESSPQVREQYLNDVSKLTEIGYMLASNEQIDGEKRICYALEDTVSIRRLIIITMGLDDKSFLSMELFCNIPIDFISKVIGRE